MRRVAFTVKPRNKYGAVKTTVDGIVFDSRKEARRYAELRLLEKAKEIFGLTCQPAFELHALQKEYGGTGSSLIGRYVCDFFYITEPSAERIYEDVKSPATRTALYRWKKKHVEVQYGIKILET